MDAKRFLTGTIVGGIVLYASGYLIFGVLVAGFYEANSGGATNVDRAQQIVWAIALGNLAYAALICYAAGARPMTGIVDGAKIGAIVGFLLWFAVDFIFYGSQDVANLTRTMVDPLFEIVHGGIAGAAIALVVGRMK